LPKLHEMEEAFDNVKKKTRRNCESANNANSNDTDLDGDDNPEVDPPAKTLPKLHEMEEAFDNGHDSDGWTGPPRGTNNEEEEEMSEEPIAVAAPGTMPTQPSVAINAEPVHISIDDDTLMKMTMPMLKHELTIRKVSLKGLSNKLKPQERLKEMLQMKQPAYSKNQIAAENKKLGKKKVDDMSAFAIGAAWKALTPTMDASEPENPQFPEARAPTMPEEEARVQPKPKQNCANKFDRPVFEGRRIIRSQHTGADGNTATKTSSAFRYKGIPNVDFLHKHHLNKESLPVEFLDAVFPMHENKVLDSNGDPHLSMEMIARHTNTRAAMAFAGEAQCEQWSGPFSAKEVRQHIGLHVMNGLGPSPGPQRKFHTDDNANCNGFIATNLGSNAAIRLRQFEAHVGLQDPRKATPDRKASPLFEVLPIAKRMRRLGPLSWSCGQHSSVDEQDIGFQGHHVDKQRISHKAEADGFLTDALCDNGFTCSAFFRNEPPPRSCTRDGFCALHARSLWLFDQLKDKCHRVWCDNLHMSCRFTKAAYNGRNKVMLAGVTRTDKRGLPLAVVQEVVKKEALPTTRGTTKAAVLIGDSECPDLVAVSVCDTKPVHFSSVVANSIEWKINHRKAWHKQQRQSLQVDCLRLNANNDYNYKMNSVDVADQLRNQCRMDHWLRQRKWWWSIFLWGLGVLLTNANIVCCRVQDEAKVPRSQRMTHCVFLHSVATAWLDRDEMDIKPIRRLRSKKRKLCLHKEVTVSPEK